MGVRRVDVNKGDDADTNYRSGLVAKDIRKKGGGDHLRADASFGVTQSAFEFGSDSRSVGE